MARPLKEIEKYLKEKIARTVDKDMLEELCQKARDIIYKRVKSGKGLNSDSRLGADETKLEKLSEKYKEYRRRRNLGPFGNANKSNLTLSGELLESMVYRIVGSSAILFIDTKTHEEAGIPTNELAKYVSNTRPFFGLSNKEEKILTVFLQRLIRQRVRALNGR